MYGYRRRTRFGTSRTAAVTMAEQLRFGQSVGRAPPAVNAAPRGDRLLYGPPNPEQDLRVQEPLPTLRRSWPERRVAAAHCDDADRRSAVVRIRTPALSKPAKKVDYLAELNREQRRAVEYGITGKHADSTRPLLVLAGAGTGKTKTLVYRVAHLSLTAWIRGEFSC